MFCSRLLFTILELRKQPLLGHSSSSGIFAIFSVVQCRQSESRTVSSLAPSPPSSSYVHGRSGSANRHGPLEPAAIFGRPDQTGKRGRSEDSSLSGRYLWSLETLLRTFERFFSPFTCVSRHFPPPSFKLTRIIGNVSIPKINLNSFPRVKSFGFSTSNSLQIDRFNYQRRGSKVKPFLGPRQTTQVEKVYLIQNLWNPFCCLHLFLVLFVLFVCLLLCYIWTMFLISVDFPFPFYCFHLTVPFFPVFLLIFLSFIYQFFNNPTLHFLTPQNPTEWNKFSFLLHSSFSKNWRLAGRLT